MELQSDEEARDTLRSRLGGVNYLTHELEKIRAEASSTGTLSVKSRNWFVRFCGNGETPYGQQGLLAAIDKSAAELNERRIVVEEERLRAKNADIDATAIPSKDVLDRILRYETRNVRYRFALLELLERLPSGKKRRPSRRLRQRRITE